MVESMITSWLPKGYTGLYSIPVPVDDDLTQAISIVIQVTKPNREETTWKVDDIKPHIISHNFTEGELGRPGKYFIKVEAQMPNDVKISYPGGPDSFVLSVRGQETESTG